MRENLPISQSLFQEVGLKPQERRLPLNPLVRIHMPELDSARGIAVLLVVFLHGMDRPLPPELSAFGRLLFDLSHYGWVGVNLFFVLSGFLITGILLDSRGRSDYFRRFYIRRALRILPAFYGMLLILIVGGCISLRFMVVSLLFLANFGVVLGVGGGYGVLWSLAVEEHFYIFWPLLVRRCSTRTLMIFAAAVCIGSPFLRILLLAGDITPGHLASFFTWFNLDGLSLGGLLAIWVRMPSFCRNHLARIAPAVLLLNGTAFFFLVGRTWADATVIKSACNLACTAFLSCLLLLGTSQWRFLVDRPILKFFGFISYGLYLVHLLAFRIADILFSRPSAILVAHGQPLSAVFLCFGAGLALGTLIAYLSRRSLEERFLRIGHASRTPSHNSVSDTKSMGMPVAGPASESWVRADSFPWQIVSPRHIPRPHAESPPCRDP